ncbi:PAQR family membrane homeostasis protein TrhA [Turneriella parva]|uniref:Channel protein, hemolysin III family n=1 Tax=Turneriella parva (strain ATCC BAA-1111 / DSM 21527 / NCTC 11395 / H) TaxID=869212 RepID=I4B368_TURPD|nr:hemolysin III family protein [Turneriella parva]AFM11725.1 channel protein, hemolysin III family [Turneriella parva DSM 21527]
MRKKAKAKTLAKKKRVVKKSSPKAPKRKQPRATSKVVAQALPPQQLRRKGHHARFRTAMRHEIANLLTHGIGAGLAIAGTAFLIVRGVEFKDPWRIVGYSLFGASMVFLYMASSLYHALWHPRTKQFLRRMDHSAIFFAIAGTYTPILLVTLRGPIGWTFFGIVWGLAIIGITFKMIFGHRYEAVSLTTYILMGWLVIFFVKPVYIGLSAGGVWLLFAGGIAYTAGTIFYSMARLPYHHMIWHLFVLTGSVLHFLCIYRYV